LKNNLTDYSYDSKPSEIKSMIKCTIRRNILFVYSHLIEKV